LVKRVTDVGFTGVVVSAVVASEAIGVVPTTVVGVGASEVRKRANTALAIQPGTEGGFSDTLATITFASSDTIRSFRSSGADICVHTFAGTDLANTRVAGRCGARIGGTCVVIAKVEVTKAVRVGRTTGWVDTGAVRTNAAFARAAVAGNLGFAGHVFAQVSRGVVITAGGEGGECQTHTE